MSGILRDKGRLVLLLLFALLTPFGVYYWPLPSHHWGADLLLLGALLCLMRAVEGVCRAAWWAALVDALTALCGLSLQDQGGYLAVATALLVLPLVPAAEGLRGRIALGWTAGIAATAGAGLLFVGVFGLPFWPIPSHRRHAGTPAP